MVASQVCFIAFASSFSLFWQSIRSVLQSKMTFSVSLLKLLSVLMTSISFGLSFAKTFTQHQPHCVNTEEKLLLIILQGNQIRNTFIKLCVSLFLIYECSIFVTISLKI